MAKLESKNRGVSWFSVSINPELRKASVISSWQTPRGLHLGVMYKQEALQANGKPPGHLNIDDDEVAPGDSYSQGFRERAAHYIPNAYHSDPAQRSSQDFDDPRGRMLIARGSKGALQNSAYAMDALRDTGVVPKMHGYDLRDTHDQHVVTENLGHAGYAPMTYPDDSDEETPGLRRLHPDAEKHLGRIDPMQLARSAYGSLSKIHDAGYTHGNVGPESLWMNKDGHVKFTHLGDARKGADDTVRQNDIFGMLKTINDHHPYSNDFYERINNHVQGSPDDWHSPKKMKAFLGMGGPQRQRLEPSAAPAAPAAAPQAASPVIPQQAKPFDLDDVAPSLGSIRKSWFNVSLHTMFRKALPEGAEGMHPREYWEKKRGFQFAGTVGEGTSGKAMRLHNGNRSEDMILKVPTEKHNLGELDVWNEIKALRALQGLPGVVKLHDSGFGSWGHVQHEEPGRAGFLGDQTPWTLTEDLSSTHVPLTSMKDLTPQQLAGIWHSTAMAYGSIHQRGYVHGDPKSEHIWVPKDYGTTSDEKVPRVKIMDFGNSRHKDDATRATTEHDDHTGLAEVMLEKMGKGKEWEPLRELAKDYARPRGGPYHIQAYHSLFDKLDDIADPFEAPERVTEPAVQPPAPQVAPPAPQVPQTPAPQVRQTPAPQVKSFDLDDLAPSVGSIRE